MKMEEGATSQKKWACLSEPPELQENTFVLFQDTKFFIICYSGNIMFSPLKLRDTFLPLNAFPLLFPLVHPSWPGVILPKLTINILCFNIHELSCLDLCASQNSTLLSRDAIQGSWRESISDPPTSLQKGFKKGFKLLPSGVMKMF